MPTIRSGAKGPRAEFMLRLFTFLRAAPCRVEAAKCVDCVEKEGCGYCLSTLRCVNGGVQGPADGSPCPNWVHDNGQCPVVPACDGLFECSVSGSSSVVTVSVLRFDLVVPMQACAAMEDCAWCASEKKCMTVGEIFSTDCRGTVFDLPCPSSFIAENRVVGNTIVEVRRDQTFLLS